MRQKWSSYTKLVSTFNFRLISESGEQEKELDKMESGITDEDKKFAAKNIFVGGVPMKFKVPTQ